MKPRQWTFLSNHAHVAVALDADPDVLPRWRDIADLTVARGFPGISVSAPTTPAPITRGRRPPTGPRPDERHLPRRGRRG